MPITMEQDDVLNMRVSAKTKEALKRAAADDRRSMSALVQIILTDWLADHGYVKATRSKKGTS